MQTRMRLVFRATWLALFAVGALIVAGCGSDDDSSTSTAASTGGASTAAAPAASSKVKRFAIVAPEKRDDFGWNQQGVDGAESVSKELGIPVDIADGSGYDNVGPVLSQLANDGANFVIAQASGYNATAPDVAQQTGVPMLIWDNPKGAVKDLVGDAETASQQGGYLAGVLAANESKSGKLGIVISADDTNWNKQAGGFVAGARSVNPDADFLLAQIGQAAYADAAGGKRVTQTVIAGGADVVIGMGDGSSFGMLQAVEGAGGKVKFIDVIGDKTSIDKKKVLLSSILWNFGPTYKQAIEDIDAGTFGTKGYTLDLANGGISLLKTDLISPDAWSAVEDAKAKITSGEVEVPLTAKKSEVQALIKQ